MVEYQKDLDKKRNSLFSDDFNSASENTFKAKTSNGGVNVELNRTQDLAKNSTSADIKLDRVFPDLNKLKFESSLATSNSAQMKLNQVVPLENKHFLELEGKADCKWAKKSATGQLQVKQAPCRWVKTILKATNVYTFAGKSTQSVLANVVFGHPKMKGLSYGLTGEYDVQNGTVKNAEIAKRYDMEQSYITAVQKLIIGKENKLGDMSCSYQHKISKDTEYGLKALVSSSETVIESSLSNKVALETEVLGKKQDLGHKLKTHLNNKGLLKMLISRKLTSNLEMNLTGHINLYDIKSVKPENFGLGLVYE